MATVELSLFGLLALASAAVSIFVSLALAMLRSPGRPVAPLALYLAALGVSSLTVAVAETGTLGRAPWLLVPLTAIPFTATPSLWRYVRRLGGIETSRWLSIGLPVALGTGFGAAWWLSVRSSGQLVTAEALAAGLVYYASSLVYLTLAARAVQPASAVLAEQRSRTVRLTWLRAIVGIMAVVFVADAAAGYLLYDAGPGVQVTVAVLTTTLSCLAAVTALGGLSQVTALDEDRASSTDGYASSGLDADHRRRLAGRIKAALDDDKLYLDNDLTLAGLADHVGVARHHVSQVVNQELGASFYALINDRRIRHAAAELLSGNEPVTAVAYASGFSNKASFYRLFRRTLGTTPTAYRRSAGVAGAVAESLSIDRDVSTR